MTNYDQSQAKIERWQSLTTIEGVVNELNRADNICNLSLFKAILFQSKNFDLFQFIEINHLISRKANLMGSEMIINQSLK